ncbi:SSI family serine proteinase inhibitor [Amycolatopsis sp. 195334CR]|uniref:SSI family serine proteinase inhibitor n=1 Tax=Amycolatopsis sp. 195334CR TaxID=2814588 RepID=UPI001A8F55D3|nr:SSI family serine proteinase inhibitor [Amycolatopsis sp. 195334CR]MBN6037548.1 protease [Amycolatopsis sp. 195334CR]
MAIFPFEPLTACALTLACIGGPAHPADASIALSTLDAGGRSGAVVLQCDPAGGTHPHAKSACDALTGAEGDLSRVTPKDVACTLEYAPVEARAFGTWKGEQVDFRTTYPNRCAADAHSGGVFGF